MHEFVGIEEIGDHGCVGAVRQHPDFHGRDRYVVGERIQLGAERGAGSRVHGVRTLRRLHGERGDRRHAVAVMRRKSFQIGRDARAARWIESRDGQENGRNVVGVTIQLRVPSALGTNAGPAIPTGVPGNRNVRGLA